MHINLIYRPITDTFFPGGGRAPEARILEAHRRTQRSYRKYKEDRTGKWDDVLQN